jgi:hypothetical protein
MGMLVLQTTPAKAMQAVSTSQHRSLEQVFRTSPGEARALAPITSKLRLENSLKKYIPPTGMEP